MGKRDGRKDWEGFQRDALLIYIRGCKSYIKDNIDLDINSKFKAHEYRSFSWPGGEYWIPDPHFEGVIKVSLRRL